jgi:multidrug resistance efflux pump
MTTDKPPIPIPWKSRLRELRLRVLPVVVFGGAVIGILSLWRGSLAAPSLTGQAEAVVANVSSYRDGILAELTASRFQKVKAGEAIAKVIVSDPRIYESTMAKIRSEIDRIRSDLRPALSQQRANVDYNQLRLDWMRRRAELASAKVDLQLAETEFKRMEELVKERLVADRMFDQARANKERAENQVAELTRLVNDVEQAVKALEASTPRDQSIPDSIEAAIAVEQRNLEIAEAELSPIILRAPIDGLISSVFHRSGEAIMAGKPIVSIATDLPVRIVGYLKPPFVAEPKIGMPVEVRTRGPKREIGLAKVTDVGTQLEPLPAALLGPVKLTAAAEFGLAVGISLPEGMNILPGEVVDLTFVSKN